MPDCPSCGAAARVINSRLTANGLWRLRRYACAGAEAHRFTLKNWTVNPHGLTAAKAQGAPGCCIFCEEPLPTKPAGAPGRPRVICRASGCKTSYHSSYRRDNPQPWVPKASEHVTWHCGCGKIARRSGWGSHKKSCIFAAWAWPVVVISMPSRMAA